MKQVVLFSTKLMVTTQTMLSSGAKGAGEPVLSCVISVMVR